MREIKFRAWILKEEIMTYFEDESYILNGDMSVDAFDYDKSDCKNYFEPCYKTVDVELMQYTGLKDKNGTEIYEGDIVKIHAHSYDYGFSKNRIGQIKFLDGSFGFYKQLSEKEYLFNELSTEYGYGELDYYEVIGNIYKNPELLEDKE